MYLIILAHWRVKVALVALFDTNAHSADGLPQMDTRAIIWEIMTDTFPIPGALAGLKLEDDLNRCWEVLRVEGRGADGAAVEARVLPCQYNHIVNKSPS